MGVWGCGSMGVGEQEYGRMGEEENVSVETSSPTPPLPHSPTPPHFPQEVSMSTKLLHRQRGCDSMRAV